MSLTFTPTRMTRLLLLRVPYFRDVILESFECEHCHFKNNTIKSAGQIQERGTVYTLRVENEQDLQVRTCSYSEFPTAKAN
jgi:zinc finger protein